MAIITPALITSLRTGFSKAFQDALAATPTDWEKIATRVPSSNTSNTYGWLNQFPKLREWVGDRVAKDMASSAYQVQNKLYEGTVAVKRTDIEDDNVGVYTPLFAEMGRAAKAHADELVFALLAAGETTLCFDGQNFFDTDHPVYPNVDGTGTAALVANLQAGTDPAWYLLDASRALKPLIFQERTTPELEAMTSSQDEGVFMRDEYRYGIRYRCNAGFGFWQLAYKSKAALDAANFNAAMAAMMGIKADGGRPMGVKPTHLVVPSTLRAQALSLIEAQQITGGESNPNYRAVEVIVSPWLS
ncbi:Mu-like prophage major head subunit gpT family protein [Thermomonas sp. S9]|uniref:Mu-like prophage major head subunit gpT family protein n=1 Tax=Thermomonas sp. S9 TaxID=2885203 RepID=UPI00216AD35A|nr:Mu-like prophage major head subunit gpT family protein [Thermomonas sp. S9]MCR6497083.1 Mu-like prophage major head subunit gpT family protein [Thermomonas sp. S9]MCR6497373.1 Mu-like prophage major head subunit gpT family protein [Thermomonas sp. S9]